MKRIFYTTLIVFGAFLLTGCSGEKIEKTPQQNPIQNQGIKTSQPNSDIENSQNNQTPSSEELINFENVGNDEVGKKIENIDSTINSTSTEGYADDASGEVLSELE